MYICPNCQRPITRDPICRCGADLSVLQAIVARADHLFNLSLAACQAGQIGRALEYLASNALLVPADLAAQDLRCELLIEQGRLAEARPIVDVIEMVDPAYPGLDRLLDVLGENDTDVSQ